MRLRSPVRPRALAVVAAFAVVATMAACSNREAPANKTPVTGSGTASAVAGVQQIVITSGTDLRFHPATIVVHPGRVRIILKNTAKAGNGPPHDIVSAKVPGMDVPLTQAGTQSETTFTAPAPGRYSFDCSIHANMGQYGTLVVTKG